jgi:hypothetical protein
MATHFLHVWKIKKQSKSWARRPTWLAHEIIKFPAEIISPEIISQINQSQGCITICDTDHGAKKGGGGNHDERSPHVNLIRDKIDRHGCMSLKIEDVGPCHPEKCSSDYLYPWDTRNTW